MIFHLAARLFANYSAEMNETWWRKQQWGGQVMLGCTSYLSPKKAFILILMSVSHSARKSKIPSLKIFVYFNTCHHTHVGVVLIANTLHKEVKSQKVMAEKVDCSASAVSKHSNGKLNVVGKRAQTRDDIQEPGRVTTSDRFSSLKVTTHWYLQETKVWLLYHSWTRDNIRSALRGLNSYRKEVLLSDEK